ncbi:gp22 [Propionibacterium phage PA6]|uniref:Gp22 n=1 Tax=Propionibacterium phage PA6 TaxID=376758 RepID=A4K489_9CAUD|nr:gp22 [Propionibacterium phage PA6]ABE68591.1 gp22 [Propionibacterium phage PA6]
MCPSGAATIVWWLPLGHYFCILRCGYDSLLSMVSSSIWYRWRQVEIVSLAWSRTFRPITFLLLSRWRMIDHMISSAAACNSFAWYAIPASQSSASWLA